MSLLIQTNAQPVYDKQKCRDLAKDIRTQADFELVQQQLYQVYASSTGQYQPRDWKTCDYDLHRIDRITYPIRGPVPDSITPKRYFVILGSATSFGTCVSTNYGHLLARQLGMPCINLSHAGASPEFFVRSDLEGVRWYLAHAAFAIVETMSSRSVSNSRFASVAGRRIARDLLAGSDAVQPATKFYQDLVAQGSLGEVQRLVTESLENHVVAFRQMVDGLNLPVLLLWMSRRTPDAFDRKGISSMKPTKLTKQMNVHPQFGDRELIEQLRKYVHAVIESSTRAGLPSRATNRFTNQPDLWWQGRPVRSYYPSPEMHLAAYERLLPLAAKLAHS